MPTELAARIDDLHQCLQRPEGPGGIVTVLSGTTTLHVGRYGCADVEARAPWTSSTPYWLASITKTFTAQLVIALADIGIVDRGADVREIFTELRHLAGPITVDHLLRMSSGLWLEEDVYDIVGHDGIVTDDDLRRCSAEQAQLAFAPGTGQMYSCANYRYLARLLEQLTGQSFADVMASHVLQPLGLNDTCVVTDPWRPVEAQASQYRRTHDARWVRSINTVSTSGDGALVSTIDDLAAWVVQCRYGPAHGVPGFDRLIDATDHLIGPRSTGYGWGLGTNLASSHPVRHHGGVSNTVMAHDPYNDVTVIAFYNCGDLDAEVMAATLLETTNDHLSIPAGTVAPRLDPRRCAPDVFDIWTSGDASWTVEVVNAGDRVEVRLPGRALTAHQLGTTWQLHAYGKVEGTFHPPSFEDPDRSQIAFGQGLIELHRRHISRSPLTLTAGRYANRSIGAAVDIRHSDSGQLRWCPVVDSAKAVTLRPIAAGIWGCDDFHLHHLPSENSIEVRTTRINGFVLELDGDADRQCADAARR